jgi:hypothetical protein
MCIWHYQWKEQKMICWFNNNGNNVQFNPLLVCFISSKLSSNVSGMYPRNKESFRNTIGLFIARTLPENTWMNDPDVYLAPCKKDK